MLESSQNQYMTLNVADSTFNKEMLIDRSIRSL